MKKLLLLLVLILCISGAYALILGDDLEMYFPMNESSGNQSRELFNQSLNLTLDATRWTIDELGNPAIEFNDFDVNGITSLATTLNPTSLMNLTLYNYTIGFRLNLSNVAPANPVLLGYASHISNHIFQMYGQRRMIFFNTNYFTGYSMPEDEWHSYTYTFIQGNNVSMFVDGIYNHTTTANSIYNFFDNLIWGRPSSGLGIEGQMNGWSLWNRTLNDSEVLNWNESISDTDSYWYGLPPPIITDAIEVTLNAPYNGYVSIEPSILFNATITPINYNVTNATLYVWNSSGEFNVTPNIITGSAANTTTWNVSNFVLGSYTWNVLGCGTPSNGTDAKICSFSLANRTLEYGIAVTDEYFDSFVYETSYHEFILNFSLISDANLQFVDLVYNGTIYSGTIIDLGEDKYSIKKAIDIPVPETYPYNFTFFWRLRYLDTQETSQNTTARNQSVDKIWLSFCNSTYPTQFINFTSKDSKNPYPEVNATFKSSWSYYLGNGSQQTNFSFENVSETLSNWTFCMSPTNLTYTINSVIEYDASAYSKNFYFLNNASLSDNTAAIDLYLLNDTDATLTVLEVVDGAQKPIEDVYIQIQAYDVGTDTYYTVAMAHTNFNGEDLVYLNWYDTLYKFILIKEGEVIKTTTPFKISATPVTFEVLAETVFDYKKFRDFIYSLYYNEATQNFVLTFTKPSGLVDSACLRVIKRNLTGDIPICLTCEESASATIYCNIADYGNGTFIASFYATGSYKWVDSITELIGVASQIYEELGNLDGTTLAIIFAGIIMTMFLITPVLGVVGMLLGMLGATALGFQPIDYGVFIGICLVGGIVIWLLKR